MLSSGMERGLNESYAALDTLAPHNGGWPKHRSGKPAGAR